MNLAVLEDFPWSRKMPAFSSRPSNGSSSSVIGVMKWAKGSSSISGRPDPAEEYSTLSMKGGKE